MTKYTSSIHELDGAVVYMANAGDRDVLVCEGKAYFGGADGTNTYELNHEVANKLRALFPFTAPKPVLGYDRSIGLGDRLGLCQSVGC